MVEDSSDLSKQCPDPLGSLGDLDVEQLLCRQGKALLVRHHGHIVQAVEVRQSLEVRLVLDQLLSTTVQQSDMRISPHDLLTIQLQNQPKDTVSRRMLRTEVDGIMADLAIDTSSLRLEVCASFGILGGALVGEMREGRIGRDESGSLVAGGLSSTTGEGSGYRTGSGDGRVSEGGGTETKPFGRIARQASEGSSHSEGQGVGRGEEN